MLPQGHYQNTRAVDRNQENVRGEVDYWDYKAYPVRLEKNTLRLKPFEKLRIGTIYKPLNKILSSLILMKDE